MKTTTERLAVKIEKLEAEKLELQTKLINDFQYGFKWYSENLYKATYMVREYKRILDALEKGTELEIVIDYLQGQVNGWSIAKSTCQLSVQESIFEFEALKEMIQDLKWYL